MDAKDHTAVGDLCPRSLPRWARRAVLMAGVAAFSAGAFWCAGLFSLSWLHHSTNTASTPHIPTLADWAKNAKKTAPSGVVGIAPSAPTGNDSSISKVPLPLILTATRPGRNVHEGYADIGVDAKSPQTYMAGAILANGTRIAEIYSDSVALTKNGQSVRLYLQGRGKGEPDIKALAALLTVGGTAPPPVAVADSHESLTDFIRPSPVYEGTVLRGYQVYAGQSASVFGQLGLQPGDVITSINGVQISDPQSAIGQLEMLTEGAAITATVERKGGNVTLSLDGTVVTGAMERQRNVGVAGTGAVQMPSI